MLELRLPIKVSGLLQVPFESCTLWTKRMSFVGFRVSPEGTRPSSQIEYQKFIRRLSLHSGVISRLSQTVLMMQHKGYRQENCLLVSAGFFSVPDFLYNKEEDWSLSKPVKAEERSEDCLAEMDLYLCT